MTPLVMALAGVVILCLLAWIVGPYFAFGTMRPLDGVVERIVFTVLAFAVLGTVVLVGRIKARRADARLKDDLSRSAGRDGPRESELGTKFGEALAALKRHGGRGASLYQLPWYVIIGPPGAGKTTAIQSSGVDFPLSQRFGKDAVRGIGGTRNCDWWFTDRAVLLDTAGRYVTQDSNAAADAGEWRDFLELVRKHRKRRPVNGVLLAISISDLLSMSEAERGRHVLAVRERLEELDRAFGIQLPVYVLFTKVDLVAGFSEYFEDFSLSEREQVWGVTAEWREDGSGDALERLDADYDDLVRQLSSRLVSRLGSERDLTRRSLVQGFPQQFAALKPRISALLTDVFGRGTDAGVVLRGFYFTSGTQVGAPFDQLIETLGRDLGIAAEPGAERQSGRSYFLTRLLNDVVFSEAGLVGRNRRLELRLLAVKTGAFAAIAVVTVLLLAAWISSYRNNTDYLADVTAAVDAAADELATSPTVSYRSVLPRLDALGEIARTASRHEEDVPLLMGFGLYQGDDVAAAAQAAYRRELVTLLLPLVSRDFQRAIVANADDAPRLYEYLKAYLMLVSPEHFDADHVEFLARRVLAQRIDPASAAHERLVAHVGHLLEAPPAPVTENESLIEGARATLRNEPLEALIFSRLVFGVRAEHPRGLDLAEEIGLNAQSVFAAASSGELEVVVPHVYTREGFGEVVGGQAEQAVASFVRESWVFGEGFAARLGDALALGRRLTAYYEARYIAYWDELLAELRFAVTPGASRSELLGFLEQVSRTPSPLDGMLRLVVEQTDVAVEPAAEGQDGRLAELFGAGGGAVPGQSVTRHYAPLATAAANVGTIKQAFSDLYVELVGGGAAAGQGAASRLRALAVSQPQPLRGWIAQISGSGESLTMAAERARIAEAWQADVLPTCRRAVAGHYPVAPADTGIPIGDFARFFGPGGTLSAFFDERLAQFVDRGAGRLRWNEQGEQLGIASSFLELFERGASVRDAFFGAGGGEPRVRFSLTPEYLDAGVDRVVVAYGGRPLVYSHGPQIPWNLEWPPADSRRVQIVFHLPNGDQPALSATGVWALFRLMERADVRPEFDAGAHVSFSQNGSSVTFRLEASSVENPFVGNELRNFRCAAGV